MKMYKPMLHVVLMQNPQSPKLLAVFSVAYIEIYKMCLKYQKLLEAISNHIKYCLVFANKNVVNVIFMKCVQYLIFSYHAIDFHFPCGLPFS